MTGYLYGPMVLLALAAVVLAACVRSVPEAASAPSERAAAPQSASGEAWEREWAKVTAEARKEGKLDAYVQWGSTTRTELQKVFRDKFGIDIEFTSFSKGNELATKLEMERRAGFSRAFFIRSMRTDVSTEGFEESIPLPGAPFVLEDEASLLRRDRLIEIAKAELGHLVR